MKKIEELTAADAAKFDSLDAQIKAGSKTFIEVGQALVTMHEGRLYRAEFKTFKEYAESRGIGRRQAYDLMAAVQLTLELESVRHAAHDQTIANIDVLKKSSAKAILALAKVPKAKRIEVLKRTVAETGGKPTASAIEKTAAQVTHRSEPVSSDSITVKEFERLLLALESRIAADAEHEQFGAVANKFVQRQMNFRVGRKEYNPYSSR